MSVSYCGSEVALEEALDDVFQKLQHHLNSCHCAVRSMSMLEEQSVDENEDFKEATKYDDTIQNDVDGMVALFKDLKSISKQVSGKPPNPDMKAWYAHHQTQRKHEAILEKERQTKIEEKE
jgi:hypothetical protein